MEVASPLPFSHASAGSKRQFPGSPGLVDSTNRNPFSHPNHNESNSMMESSSEEYVHARMKRRRFEDSMDDSNNNISLDSHNFASFPPTKNYFNGTFRSSKTWISISGTTPGVFFVAVVSFT